MSEVLVGMRNVSKCCLFFSQSAEIKNKLIKKILKINQKNKNKKKINEAKHHFSEVRVRVLANSEIAKEVAKCRKSLGWFTFKVPGSKGSFLAKCRNK